jgi:hypothetical protein
MDRVTAARAALEALVRRVGGDMQRSRTREVETLVVTDPEHGLYAVLRYGWQPGTGARVANTPFLARIKDGKVWVEAENTDLELVDELVRAGVPKEDIVLAFHPPELRYEAGYGVPAPREQPGSPSAA